MDETDAKPGDEEIVTAERGVYSVGRRELLKLVGATAVPVAGASSMTGVARAGEYGYGEGGYGENGYGGTELSGIEVSSVDATNITSDSATLEGALDDLDGADSVDCYFKWRSKGDNDWKTTISQTLSSTDPFTKKIVELTSNTEYEYRAVAEASDGDTDVGDTLSFTTEASPGIDSYSVTEAGSSNPHCEITADWAVSDSDGDLDTVIVEAYDSSSALHDASTTEVSGSSASGTENFTIRNADGETFDVTLTVVDKNGANTSRTQTVAE